MPEDALSPQTASFARDRNAAAETQKLLGTLWTRNLPLIRERLELLDRAAESSRSGGLAETLRGDAVMTAHKLAGSLGMFGYTEGTGLARQLELLLDQPGRPNADRLVALAGQLRRSLEL